MGRADEPGPHITKCNGHEARWCRIDGEVHVLSVHLQNQPEQVFPEPVILGIAYDFMPLALWKQVQRDRGADLS